jgi:hypothetical protein
MRRKKNSMFNCVECEISQLTQGKPQSQTFSLTSLLSYLFIIEMDSVIDILLDKGQNHEFPLTVHWRIIIRFRRIYRNLMDRFMWQSEKFSTISYESRCGRKYKNSNTSNYL